jgi:hypothetical protein
VTGRHAAAASRVRRLGVVEWRRVSAVDSFAHWIRPDPLSDGKAPSVSVQEVHQSAPGAVDSEGDGAGNRDGRLLGAASGESAPAALNGHPFASLVGLCTS